MHNRRAALVTRHINEEARDRMNARIEADRSLMRQRRCASEHPFGTIKRMTGGGRFLTRGLDKGKTEAALSVLAYNMIRAAKPRRCPKPHSKARVSKNKEAPENRSL
jgi:Transposase DDE domain